MRAGPQQLCLPSLGWHVQSRCKRLFTQSHAKHQHRPVCAFLPAPAAPQTSEPALGSGAALLPPAQAALVQGPQHPLLRRRRMSRTRSRMVSLPFCNLLFCPSKAGKFSSRGLNCSREACEKIKYSLTSSLFPSPGPAVPLLSWATVAGLQAGPGAAGFCTLINPAATGTPCCPSMGFITLGQGTASVKLLGKSKHMWHFEDTFSVACAFPCNGLASSLLGDGMPPSLLRSAGLQGLNWQGRGAGGAGGTPPTA